MRRVSLKPENREIHSSEHMWEEFKSSSIWADIRGHFEDLESEMVSLLSDPDSTRDMDQVKEYQVGLRLCAELLNLPESFIEDIRIQTNRALPEDDPDGRHY